MSSEYEKFKNHSQENDRLLHQEKQMMELLEVLSELIKRKEITNEDLSIKVKRSNDHIRKLLNSEYKDVAFGSIIDIAYALECDIKIEFIHRK